MESDEPRAKLLPFERPRRFPADLDRLRTKLDDEEAEFEETEIDDGLACAEAAIARGLAGGHEAKAQLLTMRAYRAFVAGDTDAALARGAAAIAASPTRLQAYILRSEILEKRGEHEAALAELDRFVERSPTNANGYLERARLHEARADGERALANFRRAVQLDPTLFEVHLSIAQALAAKGDADGASRAYARHAQQELGDAESYGMRAFLLFVSGQEELALADYEACVALSPNDPDVLAWRGLCRSRLGRLDAAVADYTRVVALTPSEARGYWRRGEVLERLGRHAEALRDLDRAIALGGDERGAAHFARGEALEALGDRGAALSSYDVSLERDPSNVACRLRRYQIHRDAENWPACQIDVDAMLTQAPDSTSLLLTHARLCTQNDRRDEALAAYDRLIAIEPGNAHAYHERAALHAGKGDILAAAADRARAFELAPQDPDIRATYGRMQAMSATTDEARAAAMELIVSSVQLDPEKHETWSLLAYRLDGAGFHAEAVRHITRAIEIDPDNAEYFDARATFIRQGATPIFIDPDAFEASVLAALADSERAIALSGECDDLELYRQRASLREEAGDLLGAIADQTKMIEIAPWFIDAPMDRARLRKLTGDMPGALADAARVAAMEDEFVANFAAHGQSLDVKRFKLDEA